MWYDCHGKARLKPTDGLQRFFAERLWQRIQHAGDVDSAVELVSAAYLRMLNEYDRDMPTHDDENFEDIALPSWYVFRDGESDNLAFLLLEQIGATHPRWRLDRIDLAQRVFIQARQAQESRQMMDTAVKSPA